MDENMNEDELKIFESVNYSNHHNDMEFNFREESDIHSVQTHEDLSPFQISSKIEESLTTENSGFVASPKECSVDTPSAPTRRQRPGRPRSLLDKKCKIKRTDLSSFLKRKDFNSENNQDHPTFTFENIDLKLENGFSKGMSLEAVDPFNPNLYCVVNVAAVAGTRIRLNFDGYNSCYDFWLEIDSLFMFPVGWCSKNGKTLEPPMGYSEFEWSSYLENDGRFAAPAELFKVESYGKCCCLFQIGMKLVAIESDQLPAYPVNRIATVTDILGDFILLKFDGMKNFCGFWAKVDSPFIKPLDNFDDDLEVPDDVPGKFLKDKYLSGMNIAPKNLFHPRNPVGYFQGLRIETVDNYNHEIIRQATIALVKGHRIKIHLFGWPKPYDYWLDDDSPLVYPPGHCSKYGLEITICFPPSKNKNISCSTTICRGIGHINGQPAATHEILAHCPYKNHKPVQLRTRLVKDEPQQCQDVNKSIGSVKRNRSFVANVLETSTDVSRSSTEVIRPRKRPHHWRSRNGTDEFKSPNESNEMRSFGNNYQLEDLFDPPKFSRLREAVNILKPHHLPKKSEVQRWSCADVAEFISHINRCGHVVASIFRYNKINGKAFLLMQQSDLTDILNIKLGPALKIYYHILIFNESHLSGAICE